MLARRGTRTDYLATIDGGEANMVQVLANDVVIQGRTLKVP